MTLEYQPAAVADLHRLCEYIEHVLKNPSAAAAQRKSILRKVSLLKEAPLMGMALRSKYEALETDIRFLIVGKQLVFYEVRGRTISVLRILDGRTDYIRELFHV